MIEESIRAREEIKEQIRALKAMKSMAAKYGIDISAPASNTREKRFMQKLQRMPE